MSEQYTSDPPPFTDEQREVWASEIEWSKRLLDPNFPTVHRRMEAMIAADARLAWAESELLRLIGVNGESAQ